ncbi:hypothetical protein [Flavobacterium capsici]|uniref:Outer membrane protein beta-barrel domain-containing protein n=1 Tax=Flavobacterium capsici TaxID=3075618 RepID=A0AA96EZ52_9FLAO|nr:MULTISPECIES: hypothetical protein [unclassified Flavobacterium]WNM19712.1 hypothetical protein RN608_03280 [Flavobacterium sp. PMR2A8]WNM21101.1 hypothetical protein RN605_10450 [Flavobacterium sp. PMTSA4]
MKENRNIDQFFKDKFENHEVNPPEEIWENIEKKLQKKKKRRVIPFWWYGSGVAALFVIGLFVFNNYYTLEIHPVNDVVIEENTSNQEKNSQDSSNVIDTNAGKKEVVVSTDSDKKNESENDNLDKSKDNSSLKNNSIIVSSEKNSNETITNDEKQKVINNKANSIITHNNSVASNTKTKEKKNNKNSNKNSAVHTSKATDIISEVDNKTLEKQEEIVQNNSNLKETKKELNKENNIDLGKIAMENQNNIATKGEVNTSKDSTAIATVEPNALEELLKEKEKKIAKEQKMNRWQVTPNLAPIYFGSFADGSPLDSNLDENTKSFNDNMSYGVAVNYAVNSRLKIRTGINTFTVDYNTNDIVFFQNSNARLMENINPTAQGSLIEIIPIKNLNTAFSRLEMEQNNGILNQRMGYIEMPMEVSYKILDKKFGVEIIGGMSTMFLSKNEVFLEADGMNVKIGEATNLNSIHYSTNFGVGFNYGFYKRFQARIEPTFKYQLNTFSRDSQNFKPYIFGIYTGISFNF